VSCPGSWSRCRLRRFALPAGAAIALVVSASVSAAPAADTIAPIPPQISVKTASSTTLSIVWTGARDNVGVVGYDVRLGDARPFSTTLERADFKNLGCGRRYGIRVVARDEAGNKSLPGVVSAWTATCGERSGPQPPGEGTPQPPPPGGPAAPPPPAAPVTGALAVSPQGSDKNPCTTTAPCATFNRAYAAAQPGQVVQMMGGTYRSQSIQASAAKSSASANVVFQPAPGATVAVSNGALIITAAHVEFHHLQMDQSGCTNTKIAPSCPQLIIQWPAHDVLIDGLKASRFYITGADHVTIANSDFGPSWDFHGLIHADTAGHRPHDILLNNGSVHDHWNSNACKRSGACLAAHHQGCGPTINDAYNVVEDSMRFYNCEDLGQLVKPYRFPNQNIVIKNSFFGASYGYYSLDLTSVTSMPNQGLQILNNTFTKGVSITAGTHYAGSTFSGNTVPALVCSLFLATGWQLGSNQVAAGAQCGTGSGAGGGSITTPVGSTVLAVPRPRSVGTQAS
jgi:hypothetical protein